jgi:hypothetical protein
MTWYDDHEWGADSSQEGDWYRLLKDPGQALDWGHGISLADNMIRILGII